MTGAKLKVLIWREWRLARKNYLTTLIVCILFAVFFWLFRLSMSVGNLAFVFNTKEILQEFGAVLYYMSAIMVGIVSIGVCVSDWSAYAADINANWLCYSYSLPIDPKMRTTVIYAVKLIKLAIGLGFSILNGFVTSVITGTPFTKHMVLFFLSFTAVVWIYDLISQFFMMHARTSKGISTAGFFVMVAIYIPILVIAFINMILNPSDESPELNDIVEKIRGFFITNENIILVVTVIGLIALPIIGWLVTKWRLQTFGDVNEQVEYGVLFRKKKKGGEQE